MGVTWLRRLAWATLVANIGIVVTGGVVRLTSSGLGCPSWPKCTDESLVPHDELGIHGAIEFGNRTLFVVLAGIALAMFLEARRSGRRDIAAMALVIGLVVPAQAVIGGVSVLTDLNPWVVSVHMLVSLAIIAIAVRLVLSVDEPLPPAVGGPLTGLAWSTFAAAWAVLYVGTVVTGSGPHAGDAEAVRNGLDPRTVSHLHADLVFLFVGLTIGLLFALLATGARPRARRAVVVLIAVELAQGAIGFVQYATDLPEILVGLHLLGAALVSACVAWALLEVRHPRVNEPNDVPADSPSRSTSAP